MGVNVQVRPATLEHAALLAPQLRAEDLAEAMAHGFTDALDALTKCVERSADAYALMFDEQVAALFGVGHPLEVVATGEEICCVWALTGRAVCEHPKAFIRASRPMLAFMLEHCGILWNYVDGRYTAALRWLRWLGFSVGEPVPFGPAGELFHPVSIRRPEWVP